MERKLRNYIKAKLRDVARMSVNKEREEAKKVARVDKALSECAKCGIYLYDGNSGKNFKKYQEEHGEDKVLWQKPDLDHIVPVFEKSENWDDYINTLFCDRSNYQALCKSCHHEKTSKEAGERKEKRKKKLDKNK